MASEIDLITTGAYMLQSRSRVHLGAEMMKITAQTQGAASKMIEDSAKAVEASAQARGGIDTYA